MSEPKRIDRRSLFDAFRRALERPEPETAAPTRGGFSLSAFYERREATTTEPEAFPQVTRREGLAAVDTTGVGVGPAEPEPEPPHAPPRRGVA